MTTKPLTFSEKMVFLISGALLGAFVVLLLLKLSESFWGGIIGLLLNTVAAWYMLKTPSHEKAGSRKKLVAYGIIGSIILTIVLAIGLWLSLSAAFQGIAS